MNKMIEMLLNARGMTQEDLAKLEDATHSQLNDLDELCAHLHDIHDANKRLVVLPDYDMDGIMSGVVGKAGLAALGFKYGLYVPRPQEGYGFGPRQIDRLIKAFPDVEAIITCDTGISCAEGARYAKEEHEIEILITDHHKEDPDTTVREHASVVVDPCGIGETYEHPSICGAHVLWQVLDRYAELYGTSAERERISLLRAFAAVGTVSDTMPVTYENRVLIKDGLDIWKGFWDCDRKYLDVLTDAPKDFADAFRGIYAICRDFAAAGKLRGGKDGLNEDFFGFYLAPSFNSVKRMDGELSRGFDVFFGGDQKVEIAYLMELNAQRKEEVDEAYRALAAQDNPMAPYIYMSDAKPGLMGLLAMRMLAETGKPCLVVSGHATRDIDLLYSGSGRSPEWYPFLTRTNESGLEGHRAGHEGAFGCSFLPEELDALYDFLKEDVPAVAQAYIDEFGSLAQSDYDILIRTDGEGDVGIDEPLFLDFIDEVETLRPFGRDWAAPQLMLVFDSTEATYNVMGKEQNHLKMKLDDGMDVICWNQASFIDDGMPDGEIRVLGHLEKNEFRGKVSAQFVGDVVRG